MIDMQDKVVIILNGTLYDPQKVKTQIDGLNAFVICADGGILHAEKMGVVPDLLLGDIDSVQSVPAHIETEVYPTIKDDTDALLAVKHALSHGISEIYIIAPFGGRVDHTMANLSLLQYVYDNGGKIVMMDGKNRVSVLPKGETVLGEKVQYVSFFPLYQSAEMILQGFHYNGTVSISSSYSVAVSNRYDEQAKITVTDQPIIMIEIL